MYSQLLRYSNDYYDAAPKRNGHGARMYTPISCVLTGRQQGEERVSRLRVK